MRPILTLLICTFHILASTQPSLKDLSFLIGTWKINKVKEGKVSTETWAFEDDRYYGHSITVQNGKVTFEENMTITSNDGSVLLSVKSPDNENWVSFTNLGGMNADKAFVFENKSHDFPKYISYKIPLGLKMEAEIGDFDKVKIFYPFIKVINDTTEIKSILSNMQLKYYLGDLSSIGNYYDLDGIVTGGNTFIEGRKEIRSYWKTFAQGQWNLQSDWIKLKGNTAIQRGKSRIKYTDGRQPDKVEFLINWIKKAGKWYLSQDIYW
jgi:hypothetical protein